MFCFVFEMLRISGLIIFPVDLLQSLQLLGSIRGNGMSKKSMLQCKKDSFL
jgi:hypothetical protein